MKIECDICFTKQPINKIDMVVLRSRKLDSEIRVKYCKSSYQCQREAIKKADRKMDLQLEQL